MGYGAAAITFHWLTAVLVVTGFILGPGGSEERIYSAVHDFDRPLHEVIGLSILLLTVARLAWKALVRAPELPPIPLWMKLASRTVQALLYVLLVVTPLTAIAGAWLEGHPLTLGVLGEIAPPLAKNVPLGERIAELHTWLGDAVMWVAGLHAGAALVHHFVLRDEVLATMLPASWRGALRRH